MKKEKLEFHDVANIFPMMEKGEFEALKDDIRRNGLNEPIWLFKGKIIDGRNRYLACIAVNEEPKFKQYEGHEDDLIDFVLSLNLHRRHLNTSQKACLAVDLLPTIEKRNEEIKRIKNRALRKGEVVEKLPPPEKSRAKAARIFGVNERYVSDAKKLKQENERVFESVKKGDMTIAQAKKSILKKEVEVVEKIPQPDSGIKMKLTAHDKKKIKKFMDRDELDEKTAVRIVTNDRIELEKRKKKLEERRKKKAAEALTRQKIGFYVESDVKERLKSKTKNISEYLRKLIEADLEAKAKIKEK